MKDTKNSGFFDDVKESEMESEKVQLHGMETFVPTEQKRAYRVVKGTVFVYIIPWKNGEAGRKLFLCEMPMGRIIPSFVYKDKEYKEWRFSFVAQSEVELEESKWTSVLEKKFLRSIGLSNLEKESFENSLVEYYQKELLEDIVRITREERHESISKNESYQVIKETFKNKNSRIEGDDWNYKAVVYAARKMSQEVISYDKLCNLCKDNMDIPHIVQASHFICRSIVVDHDWYCKDSGVIIGTIDKETVACVPCGRKKYEIYYPQTGKVEKLSKQIAEKMKPQAYLLERALPNKKIQFSDLIHFARKGHIKWDLYSVLFLGLIGSLIGILLPSLNQQIYDDYIPLGNFSQLIQICMVIGTFMIGNLFFSIVKELSEFRIQSRVAYEIQDAIYYRVFHLPESFFRKYESADLALRLRTIGTTANQFIDAIVITGIATIFSLVYLFRMFKYTAKLTWVAIVMILIYAIILAVIHMNTQKYEKKIEEYKGNASSKLYQYLNGIEKIRMAGVEEQAIHQYMLPFADEQSEQIKQNRISQVGMGLSGIAMTIFSMVLYFMIVKSKLEISMGSFMAFNTALGSFAGAVLQMIDKVMNIYQLYPTYERIKPVLEETMEDDTDSELPGELTGNIELNHVTFSYGEGRPIILNDISLNIKKGEYIGIVGPSGCGKSTLLKLLLGFEKPSVGTITFDGKDLASMNKAAFRQNLGVVLQNGKLISGSIAENITITEPKATRTDVQRVVEAVGLKQDIAKMPMGLETVIGENANTISGGQAQRILIARAIIRNPAILIMDEATSALDNVTQSMVCESLDKMNATRIVIAHRLSTIRECDRIIVLSEGHIAEEGDYDTLMKQRGIFYQLASRQIAD